MNDAGWHDKCKANYEALAAKLVAQGYERANWSHSMIPATFHKDGRVLYLARKLGSPEWYAARLGETGY